MDGLKDKDKHRLKFAFPGATFCENEYCRLLHLFVLSTFISWSRKLQRSRLQTIICQMQRRSGKKPSLFTLDQHYQSHMMSEQSKKKKKKKKKSCAHTQSDITLTYNSSPSCLILIAICLKSQVPVPHSCFQSERN